MKKTLLIGAMALALSAGTASAVEYHKAVYQVPGKTADQIKMAANLLSNNVKIKCGSFFATIEFRGKVNMENKDGRYRLTFNDFTSDTGYQLAELPQNKESCDKAIKELADSLHQDILNWSDF